MGKGFGVSRAAMSVALGVALLSGAASAQQTERSTAHPEIWPKAKSQGLVDARTEALVDKLLKQMSVEEKIGQLIQGDIASIKPEELRKYPLGSILAGGNSPPLGADERGPASAWLDTARAFRTVSLEKRPGHVPIPTIFGVDAVHGNSNIVGAVIFPHNIALGAANDPDLIRRIGRATAVESAVIGADWSFAPTLAVPQDDRWGRTYEGYSEAPDIVRAYAPAMVEGLQGKPGEGRIQKGNVAASVKHFLGDGGTKDGVDQGDTQVSEEVLRDTHGAGYPGAVNVGAMTVMASFNSWNGEKMHGNQSLLTGVLKGRMGFDGFIVGDWNGHGQVAGCTNTDCARTFIAGLDMAMAPDSWKGLFDNTLAQVKSGKIPMARVDDAVRRVLRVKARLGLFEEARPFEGRFELLGSPEHRAVAREAVAKSLVLLKNNGSVLPVRAGARVLVAGPAADDIGLQSGGWTLSWQGTGNKNSDFPNGESIWGGIQRAVAEAGGKATLSADGSFAEKPDVAIVVFGEQPYAEMRGDIRTLEFEPGDKQALALLRKLKAAGVPTVSVFLSGRPLWVNPEINASDAFVAAWLPGSEGGGIADVLVAGKDGAPRRGFTGKLSFSWPKTAGQFVLNRGMEGYDPLFAYGYGLTYADKASVPQLGEVAGVDASLANTSVFFAKGATPAPFSFATDSRVQRSAVDSATAQEGAVQLRWPAGAASTVRIGGAGPLNLVRETNADLSLQIEYRVDTAPTSPVWLSMDSNATTKGIDVTAPASMGVGQWRSVKIRLSCFADAGVDMASVSAPFTLTASAPFAISIADARLVADPAGSVCPSGN